MAIRTAMSIQILKNLSIASFRARSMSSSSWRTIEPAPKDLILGVTKAFSRKSEGCRSVCRHFISADVGNIYKRWTHYWKRCDQPICLDMISSRFCLFLAVFGSLRTPTRKMENQTETKDTYKQHQQQQLQSRPAGPPPSTQAGNSRQSVALLYWEFQIS
ncbi:hypothetical protein ACSBR1_008322 [Camellia fascicularis]